MKSTKDYPRPVIPDSNAVGDYIALLDGDDYFILEGRRRTLNF